MGTVQAAQVRRIKPDMEAARPPWAMPEPRDVTVNGVRIRYWERGAGEPLVLMHGFSGSAPFEWGRVIAALAKGRHVIALQCVGFAPSEQPALTYTTDALVTHLGGFLAALGLRGITLVGESFGGWLVGSYAVRAAKLGLPPIDKLAVVGGPIGQLRPPKPDTPGFVHAPVIAEVEAWMRTQAADDNDQTRAAILRDSGLAKGDLDLQAVATIVVPTLLMWGDKDALIPLTTGEAAAGVIPNAQLVVFEGIGHIPSVECPNEFTTVLSDFAES